MAKKRKYDTYEVFGISPRRGMVTAKILAESPEKAVEIMSRYYEGFQLVTAKKI